ncbi:hypothetical protein HGA64_03445 [Candidatus Falkowbacteria bacterium]|nr:hypothetical protein [Candidatus Falkowbacteria bacterium]
MTPRRGRKIKKIDYCKRQYRNPFFNQKNKVSKISADSFFNWKIASVFFLSVFLFSFFAWGVFWSPWFKINSISISVPEKVNGKDVEAQVLQLISTNRFLLFPQRSLAVVDTNRISREISAKYALGGIKIKQDWPHGLTIELLPKEYHYIWHEGGAFYQVNRFDQTASLIPEQEAMHKNLPIIDSIGPYRVQDGKLNAKDDRIAIILDASVKFATKPGKMGVTRFAIEDQNPASFQAITVGPKLIFNSRDNLDRQIAKYEAAASQVLHNELAQKKYIDLRFGDKIYYQ